MDKRSVLKYIDENKFNLISFHRRGNSNEIEILRKKKKELFDEMVSTLPEKTKVGKFYIKFDKEWLMNNYPYRSGIVLVNAQIDEINEKISLLEKDSTLIGERVKNDIDKLKMNIILDGMTPEIIQTFKSLFININY